MGRTACTEPQCLYKGALYFLLTFGSVQLTSFFWDIARRLYVSNGQFQGHMLLPSLRKECEVDVSS
jgi:hypothetical protein